MASPCPSCGQPMHADAIVCPHCNARRAGATSGLAGKRVSADEVKAILAIEAKPPDKSEGLFATLILPHPNTSGGARAAELALTLAALPLVLAGALFVMFSGRRTQRQMKETSGEWPPAILMSVIGGLSLWGLAGMWVTIGCVGAMLARAAIRDRHYVRDL